MAFTTASVPTITLKLRPFDPRHGTLTAWLDVQMPSGLCLYACGLHAQSSRCLVTRWAVPWVRDGQLVIGDKGKPQYSPAIGVRSRWSRKVIGAVRQLPEVALPTEDEEQADMGRQFWEAPQ